MSASSMENTAPLLFLVIILSSACAGVPERGATTPQNEEPAGDPAPPKEEGSDEEEEMVMALDGGFIEVDGLRLMQVHCSPSIVSEEHASIRQSEGFAGVESSVPESEPLPPDPFAILSWVMELSEKRAALDACAPSGAAFALQFPAESAPTLLTSSDEAANDCVLSELSTAPRPHAAVCRALLLIGESDAAMQAAASLLEGGDS